MVQIQIIYFLFVYLFIAELGTEPTDFYMLGHHFTLQVLSSGLDHYTSILDKTCIYIHIYNYTSILYKTC